MAKKVIEIQSPEEAEILLATRKKIKELRLRKKKDANKVSAGEFPELQKIKKSVDALIVEAAKAGKIDTKWNLKRLAQVGTKQPKNWATKRRTILGLVKKRRKKKVETKPKESAK